MRVEEKEKVFPVVLIRNSNTTGKVRSFDYNQPVRVIANNCEFREWVAVLKLDMVFEHKYESVNGKEGLTHDEILQEIGEPRGNETVFHGWSKFASINSSVVKRNSF